MSKRLIQGFLFLSATVAFGACRDDAPTEPAPFPDEAVIFDDGFGEGIDFQAFSGSKLDALQQDAVEKFEGESSLRISVPAPTDPSGSYAGGAFVASVARNLTEYNALTFYAKANRTATLNVAGIGNDNTGNSLYTAEAGGLPLTTTWARYVIPFPLASKLTQEQGLFFFAEGAEEDQAYTIWLDEVKFDNVSGLGSPQPSIDSDTLSLEVGASAAVSGTRVSYTIDGRAVVVAAMPSYFTFSSSNTAVATVSATGAISVVGEGTTTITASLGDVAASGSIVINTVSGPQTAAPTPEVEAAKVISLFSNAYTNVTVDTWSAEWDDADVEDVQIAGNDTKRYSNLSFAGIEFTSAPVDASSMTHFHMDIWTADPTAAPATFKIKLVDFGADGAYDGGDDVEHEITLDASTTPALQSENWVSIDIPFSRFANLTTRGALAQMIISGDPNTVFVDNVYFYEGDVSSPETAAPTPTVDAANVISLFSDAYTDVTVDTWSAGWDQADVSDVEIAGNATKKYDNLVFAGIEFTSAPVDASEMTHFHMDIWTPDATTNAAFKIKLVDFGADGAYDGGDDVEHEITLDASSTPALQTGSWVSIDLPLSAFTGLTTKGALAQMIIAGDPTTVFVDNVYFHQSAPSAPTAAAPTPEFAAADVISLFSDAYEDVTVDTWSAGWDNADVANVEVDGNATKKYTNLVFAGIEFTSAPVDASGMTHMLLNIWTPDATTDAAFKIKLVDFGANGAYGGDDDVEHELTLTASSTPALATGSWLTLDIPLSEFTGLTTKGALAQLIISGDPNTVFVDNVLFHK